MRICVILFLCLPTIISAQLNGKYSEVTKDHKSGFYRFEQAETFVFLPHKKFIYVTEVGSSCFSSIKRGHGHYLKKNGVLTLTFERDTAQNSFYIDESEGNGDSISIDVQLYDDSTKAAIPFGYISFSNLFMGKFCDNKGHCTFRIKKSEAEDLLQMRSALYTFKTASFKLNWNYSITVYLARYDGYTEGKQGEVRKYLFKRKNPSTILLREYDSERDFKVFKKVRPRGIE